MPKKEEGRLELPLLPTVAYDGVLPGHLGAMVNAAEVLFGVIVTQEYGRQMALRLAEVENEGDELSSEMTESAHEDAERIARQRLCAILRQTELAFTPVQGEA